MTNDELVEKVLPEGVLMQARHLLREALSSGLLADGKELDALKLKLAQWESAYEIGVKKWVDFVTETKAGMEDAINNLSEKNASLKLKLSGSCEPMTVEEIEAEIKLYVMTGYHEHKWVNNLAKSIHAQMTRKGK